MHILTDSDFFKLLLKASAQAAVLTVMILVAQRLLGRRLEPRWRSALWLLVVVRLTLPWTIPSPVSVFNLTHRFPSPETVVTSAPDNSENPVLDAVAAPALPISAPAPPSFHVPLLPAIWAAGALAFSVALGVRHVRFHRRVLRARPLLDETTLGLLEECKTSMSVRVPVALVETSAVDGPCLFGFLRPRLLLPPGFTGKFSRDELRFVFLHELGHIKRHDIPLGWLAAVLQIVHWFNPFAWLAFFRMRADRELACDALALTCAGANNAQPYGRTIIKLLENFGDSLRSPGLAGILEDKQQMKQRLVMIAQFGKSRRHFGLAAALFFALALAALTDAQLATPNNSVAASTYEQQQTQIFQSGNKWAAYSLWDSYAHGKNGVASDSAKADQWLREFVKNAWLAKFEPVGDFKPETPGAFLAKMNSAHTRSGKNDLGTGSFFRTTKQGDKLIGSFLISRPDDFKAAIASVPAVKLLSVEPITPETFVAYEASPQESLAAPSAPPKIIATSPVIGATDVDPSLSEIAVTFDQDMDTGGMSWTGGPPDFPDVPNGRKPKWRDKRTCVLPVSLQGARHYRVGINSPSFRNFASENGAAAVPTAITFTTKSSAIQ